MQCSAHGCRKQSIHDAAIVAHLALLDELRRGPRLRGDGGNAEVVRAGADDAEVSVDDDLHEGIFPNSILLEQTVV